MERTRLIAIFIVLNLLVTGAIVLMVGGGSSELTSANVRGTANVLSSAPDLTDSMDVILLHEEVAEEGLQIEQVAEIGELDD